MAATSRPPHTASPVDPLIVSLRLAASAHQLVGCACRHPHVTSEHPLAKHAATQRPVRTTCPSRPTSAPMMEVVADQRAAYGSSRGIMRRSRLIVKLSPASA